MQDDLALFPLSGMQEPTQIQVNETRQDRILVSPTRSLNVSELNCSAVVFLIHTLFCVSHNNSESVMLAGLSGSALWPLLQCMSVLLLNRYSHLTDARAA